MQPTPKIWYLGPAGDLRALSCPLPDISTTVTRYGGVHQGLSGARTMDVTGHKVAYTFEFDYMEYDEWRWLEALHLRLIPGPYRLINPLRKNRLTPEASMVRPWYGSRSGVWMSGGQVETVRDWPAAVLPGNGTSLQWKSRPNTNATLRWGEAEHISVMPGETVTGSVWAKASEALTTNLTLDWFDVDGVQTTSETVAVNLTTEWQSFSNTAVAPAGTGTAKFATWGAPATPEIHLAAAQVESGPAMTPWEMGGGSPVVLFDQLETSSPRFPLTDCSLTLLEA